MKKVLVSLILVIVLVTGCLDYKTYDLPAEEPVSEDTLVDEIANLEKELELEKEVEEEVVLPDLTNETEEVGAVELEEDLQVISVKENQLVTLNVNASDPDKDPVEYTFSAPFNDAGQWQTQYGDAGEYLVTITATDGVHTTSKKVKIAVERVNVAPVVKGVRDLTVNEGEVVSFTPTVTDPNKDDVTVVISAPLKDGRFATDHTSAGEYRVIVTASDGELETEQNFVLAVRDVNVKPDISNVPKNIVVKEGQNVKIQPIITDLDGDEIVVTISEPLGDDGVWETSFTDHGEYTAVVTVDDGKDKVVLKVIVVVEDVNMPPEFLTVDVETQ